MHLETHMQANDPNSILPHYRELVSGAKSADNTIYTMAYPSSIYPILNLGYPIYDNLGNKIDPGHYEVALSVDRKYLLLIQSKHLIAKVPVINIDFDEQAYDENKEKFEELYAKLEKYQIKKNKKRINQYQQEIEYQNRKMMSQNKAEIDNSNPQYFVIDYKCNFATATGFIRRASQD